MTKVVLLICAEEGNISRMTNKYLGRSAAPPHRSTEIIHKVCAAIQPLRWQDDSRARAQPNIIHDSYTTCLMFMRCFMMSLPLYTFIICLWSAMAKISVTAHTHTHTVYNNTNSAWVRCTYATPPSLIMIYMGGFCPRQNLYHDVLNCMLCCASSSSIYLYTRKRSSRGVCSCERATPHILYARPSYSFRDRIYFIYIV